MNRDIESWLSEYAESHQNHTNVLIHNICVLLITWCVVSFLYHVKIWKGVDLAVIGIALASIFYFRLSPLRGVLMVVVLFIFYASVSILSNLKDLLEITGAIFVVSWVMQFVGHKIEGKKPSLFKDLVFLLIGPLWVVEKILVGIKK